MLIILNDDNITVWSTQQWFSFFMISSSGMSSNELQYQFEAKRNEEGRSKTLANSGVNQ